MNYTTDIYEGMLAETITHRGHAGDAINAYFAKPLGPGPFPGVVLIHHRPGWDEWYREATRRFATTVTSPSLQTSTFALGTANLTTLLPKQ